MTPPAIPHAFYSEEHTEGHVLTVRQEVVRAWCAALPGVWPEAQQRTPAFVPLAGLAGDSAAEAERLIRYATLLGMWADEHHLTRRDSIERWLFEAGKTTPRRPTAGGPA